MVEKIKAHLKLKHVRLANCGSSDPVKTIAICAGSGGSMLNRVPASLYLTGEMSHHQVLDANQQGTRFTLLLKL